MQLLLLPPLSDREEGLWFNRVLDLLGGALSLACAARLIEFGIKTIRFTRVGSRVALIRTALQILFDFESHSEGCGR